MSVNNTGNGNLITFAERTPEEMRAIASKGGIASRIARNNKRKMREAMEILMAADIPVKNVKKELIAIGLEDEDLNIQMAIAYGQVMKSIESRDTQAAVFCRDTAGDKPTDKIEYSGTTTLIKDDLNE